MNKKDREENKKSHEDSFNMESSSSSSAEKPQENSNSFEKPDQNYKKAQYFSNLQKQETTISDDNIFNFNVTNIRYVEIGVKLCAVFILMMFVWYFGTGSGKHMNDPNFCLDDKGHNYLDNLNHYIHENKYFRHFLEITSSFCVDTVLLNALFLWVLEGNDGFPFYMLLFFYGPRGIIQAIFTFRFPKNGIWDYPGFPSLTVPYGLTCDFYFSGHCGFTTANAYYMWKLGRKKTSIYLICVCCYLAFVLILTRIHYTIDIPIGIMYGFWSCRLVMKYYKKVDLKIRDIIAPHAIKLVSW